MTRAVTWTDALRAAQATMLRPWVWGEADCCVGVCDALLALGLPDPMASLRGAYGSQAEADALAEAAGGFAGLVEQIARAGGYAPATGPTRPADVGVTAQGVHAPDRRALALAVGPGAWACKSPRGYTIVGSVERAWRPG